MPDNTETTAMSLDDNPEPVEAMPAKDNDGIPYCRKHHCRMKAKSSGSQGSPTTYYGCRVPKCKETAQKIKTSHINVVPADPQKCARCSTDRKAVYCERDGDSSTAASVILRCPKCGWKSNALAVPQIAAAHFARKSSAFSEPMVGDR